MWRLFDRYALLGGIDVTGRLRCGVQFNWDGGRGFRILVEKREMRSWIWLRRGDVAVGFGVGRVSDDSGCGFMELKEADEEVGVVDFVVWG